MTAKHQVTNKSLKPTVRIYKNMRNRMVEKGIIKSGAAPSYFMRVCCTMSLPKISAAAAYR